MDLNLMTDIISSKTGRKVMLKIAIVGAGIIGKSHSDAILSNPECELVAVCDVDEAKAKLIESIEEYKNQRTDS